MVKQQELKNSESEDDSMFYMFSCSLSSAVREHEFQKLSLLFYRFLRISLDKIWLMLLYKLKYYWNLVELYSV
jgi:hypothetical protein